jgi:hypothetical protein
MCCNGSRHGDPQYFEDAFRRGPLGAFEFPAERFPDNPEISSAQSEPWSGGVPVLLC